MLSKIIVSLFLATSLATAAPLLTTTEPGSVEKDADDYEVVFKSFDVYKRPPKHYLGEYRGNRNLRHQDYEHDEYEQEGKDLIQIEEVSDAEKKDDSEYERPYEQGNQVVVEEYGPQYEKHDDSYDDDVYHPEEYEDLTRYEDDAEDYEADYSDYEGIGEEYDYDDDSYDEYDTSDFEAFDSDYSYEDDNEDEEETGQMYDGLEVYAKEFLCPAYYNVVYVTTPVKCDCKTEVIYEEEIPHDFDIKRIRFSKGTPSLADDQEFKKTRIEKGASPVGKEVEGKLREALVE